MGEPETPSTSNHAGHRAGSRGIAAARVPQGPEITAPGALPEDTKEQRHPGKITYLDPDLQDDGAATHHNPTRFSVREAICRKMRIRFQRCGFAFK